MDEVAPTVPLIDGGAPRKVELNERGDYEFRLLEADAKARENLNREADQRYWLRWAAVVLVVLIIGGMALLLNHVSHWLPNNSVMINALIALHVAPIVSMTTLAIALLVAAFRGFKEGDEKAGTFLASDGARSVGLIN